MDGSVMDQLVFDVGNDGSALVPVPQRVDPDGTRHGLPTYPYRWAPEGLLTIRQLRAQGLRPGGQTVAAQILWRRGLRVAYLYRADLALPRRQATPAQLSAIPKALRSRRRRDLGWHRWRPRLRPRGNAPGQPSCRARGPLPGRGV